MQVRTETDTGTHTLPTLSDRLVNTAVQSEADTRLAVTHSGPGPALSLAGKGRVECRSVFLKAEVLKCRFLGSPQIY